MNLNARFIHQMGLASVTAGVFFLLLAIVMKKAR